VAIPKHVPHYNPPRLGLLGIAQDGADTSRPPPTPVEETIPEDALDAFQRLVRKGTNAAHSELKAARDEADRAKETFESATAVIPAGRVWIRRNEHQPVLACLNPNNPERNTDRLTYALKIVELLEWTIDE
jgi:hypothetical protein